MRAEFGRLNADSRQAQPFGSMRLDYRRVNGAAHHPNDILKECFFLERFRSIGAQRVTNSEINRPPIITIGLEKQSGWILRRSRKTLFVFVSLAVVTRAIVIRETTVVPLILYLPLGGKLRNPLGSGALRVVV